jgi:hypothetical protein
MMPRALLHNTVRIEIQKADGSTGLGTGFFYTFNYPGQTSSIPVIVLRASMSFLAVLSDESTLHWECQIL